MTAVHDRTVSRAVNIGLNSEEILNCLGADHNHFPYLMIINTPETISSMPIAVLIVMVSCKKIADRITESARLNFV